MPRGVNRLDGATQQGRLWTPAQISPIAMETWCDPNAGLDFATGVSKLYNLAGGVNYLQQGTGAKQPGLVSTGPNAKSMLNFDGTADYLGASTALYAYNGSNGYTVYCVAENNGTASIRSMFGRFNGTGALQVRWNSNHKLAVIKAGAATLLEYSTASATSAFHICGCSVASNFTSLSLNGTEESNGTNPAFTQDWESVGLSANETEWFAGRMGEIIICTTMQDAPTRRKIEGYLAWRWGLVENLPGDHIFKNRPPVIGD